MVAVGDDERIQAKYITGALAVCLGLQKLVFHKPDCHHSQQKMSDQIDILFFGDQTVDTHAFLKSVLTRGKSNPLINSFIVKASALLREEVAQLPSLDRQSIPNFSTVQELSDRHHEGQLVNTAIESALLCISQLAHYLGYVAQPSI